ncbi:MAG: flagellar basal body P-ring formation chaperone FlgA [Cycloclasticus sp.]
MKLFLKKVFFLLLIVQPVLAADDLFEDHQHIKQQAVSFLSTKLDALENEYTIQILNIDHRLKVKKCPSKIEINLAEDRIKAGKNTLKVRCNSGTPWRLFMSANIKLFAYAITTKNPLRKGHQIQKNDLELKKIELANLRSPYLTNANQAVNFVLKKRLNRGEIVSVNNLSKPIIIKKGDAIEILAKNKGFQISMKGVALKSGSKGDKITAKNMKTRRTIQGIILDKHTVKVNL